LFDLSTLLLVVHIFIALAMIGVVLLQRSEGGALGIGGGGGGGGFMTGRGAANALTRTTAILAAAFFATSILLTVLGSQNRDGGSVIESTAPEDLILDSPDITPDLDSLAVPAPSGEPESPARPEPPRPE